ncbi:FHA domain-containing protein [Syntrophobacter fumaroxidans]|uniref:histidine kinase n=1 Tax=Syntrophobacter fumaroxidans (strain DSM 10017 / MPOB) TaxID=335543 RepID=A0LLB7_SYNFM|nr:FHA domain-containing protein [Syntrophobacter fumaroxidans]ABK18219.1 FHA domain containing protein [Syntrophobacter fumaroxidans MPOB]
MITSFFLQEEGSRVIHRVSLPCVMGREEGVDLRFADPTVSHRHALISEENDHIWIDDLGSLNGIYVNDVRIEDKAPLKPGDTIRLGRLTFSVCRSYEEVAGDTIAFPSLHTMGDRRLDRQRLKWIYEITVELSEKQDPALLGERFFSRLKDIYQQDQGYLGVFKEDGSLESVFSDASLDSVPVSRSIVDRLLQNGESFILEDALGGEALNKDAAALEMKIRSALCVPLLYHNQIHGLIYLSRSVPGAYSHEDLEFLRTVSCVLAPMVENARLWAEIKGLYASTVDSLKETQSRLIEVERAAAYARLAQAMAHEIRNPLMVIGGMVRRMRRPAPDEPEGAGMQAVMSSVERIETVLREVDGFVKLPPPTKQLRKIDSLILEEIRQHDRDWKEKDIRPQLVVGTSHLMIPIDDTLFRKALSLIFRESLSNVPRGSELSISIRDRGGELEIEIGRRADRTVYCEAFDPALQHKPWVLDLFLNMGHKIIADQDGKLLLDRHSSSVFPMVIRLPRIVKP